VALSEFDVDHQARWLATRTIPSLATVALAPKSKPRANRNRTEFLGRLGSGRVRRLCTESFAGTVLLAWTRAGIKHVDLRRDSEVYFLPGRERPGAHSLWQSDRSQPGRFAWAGQQVLGHLLGRVR
jgi:hypothetical protein